MNVKKTAQNKKLDKTNLNKKFQPCTLAQQSVLHKNNLHRTGYDFTALVMAHSALEKFIIQNKFNNRMTIDFSNANAVKALNLALLKKYYQIDYWDIPQGYLCPPIPGRVDYIHYLAELLNTTFIPSAQKKLPITALDIGTGASCIYPILGQQTYGWHFVASDIDQVSLTFSNLTIQNNSDLANKIQCRLQNSPDNIFTGIIQANEFYHLTLCNPPFHHSLSQANLASKNKWENLKRSTKATDKLNFGGQKAELWCKGGELSFIRNMIKESQYFQKQVLWFTCLVSKKDNLSRIKLSLKKAKVSKVKVVKMAQGNKTSRFIAWSYLVTK